MKINILVLLLFATGFGSVDARFRERGKSAGAASKSKFFLATHMDVPQESSDENGADASPEQSAEAPQAGEAAVAPEQLAINEPPVEAGVANQPPMETPSHTRIIPPVYVEHDSQAASAMPISAAPVAAVEKNENLEKTSPVQVALAESGGFINESKMNLDNNPEILELLAKSNVGFDVAKKQKQVQALVDKAITFFNDHTLDECCHEFVQGKAFLEGELYIFLHDLQGNTFANGYHYEYVWRNLWDLKDQFNTYIIQELIKTAKEKRDWVTYYWYGATKVSYVKEVVKNGKSYVIGSGYYSHSKDDQVVALVKGAVALFNLLVNKQGYPAEEAFSSFSYPLGRFVFGDLYIYALDFQGMQVAHGDRPGLIGTNAWQYQDAKGTYVNREIVKKLKESSYGGVWVEYVSKGAPKLAYAEKVVDEKKKIEYFIACGYYPTATRAQAIDLVKRGYEYMKRQGKTRAVEAFSSKRDDSFRFGDLALYAYTTKGVSIADGTNAEIIGTNQWDWKDEDGVLYIQEIIKKAQEGGGWVNVRIRNSFESLYIEPIELGLEKYVILTSFFPISKKETALLLVKSAVSILKSNTEMEAMRAFTQPGSFLRGDLFITVYDSEGICLVHGENYDDIWKNMLDVKDENGKPYVRLLINEVKRGPVQLTYTLRGAQKTVFAEQVVKEDKTYTVVCGYYL